jgi:hypothetical protein
MMAPSELTHNNTFFVLADDPIGLHLTPVTGILSAVILQFKDRM